MKNEMIVSGTIYLTIEKNYHLDEQVVVFETVCKYMGLMDNNCPNEEIHHAEDNIWFYDQGEVSSISLHRLLDTMRMLDIKITLKKNTNV